MARKAKKNRSFWLWLTGLFLAGLVVCVVVLHLLWGELLAYQQATPQNAVLATILQLQQGEQPADLPPQLLPGKSTSEADYWAFAQELVKPLLAEYDSLRFFSSGDEQDLRYTVVNEEDHRVEFLLGRDQNHEWQAWPVVQAPYGCRIEAPANVRVFANDILLDENNMETQTDLQGFELAQTVPQRTTYVLEHLFKQPVIEAECDEGVCKLSWQGDTAVVITVVPPEEQAQTLTRFFDATARLYANFISEDAAFSQLAQSLVPGTTFHKKVRGFDNSWYVSHDSVEFENLTVENLCMEGPGTASADVRFTYIVKRDGLKARQYPSHYKLCAENTDSGWKLLDLQIK